MTSTPRFALALLAAAQAQKHVTVNAALADLDFLAGATVLDRDLGSPPGSPAEGDGYLVATPAAGAWAGLEGRVVYYLNGGWRSFAPFAGFRVWVADERLLVVYESGVWRRYAPRLRINTYTATRISDPNDVNAYVRMNVGSANNFRVEPDSVLGSIAGDRILLSQIGTGQTTITAGTGVTLTGHKGFRTSPRGGRVEIVQTGANAWDVLGELIV